MAPDGRHEADLSLLLLAVGDNGQPVAQARLQGAAAAGRRRLSACCASAGSSTARASAIKEAGGYQIRAAVQDDRSKAIGTSAQFVEVPKVGKDRVALSGVVMMDVESAPAQAGSPRRGHDAMRTDVIADGVLGEPAIKIFKPGSQVAYTFEIYDGRGKRKAGSRRRPRSCATARRSTRRRPRRSGPRRRTPGRSRRCRSAAAVARPGACRAAPIRCRSASRRTRARAQSPGVAVGRFRGALMPARGLRLHGAHVVGVRARAGGGRPRPGPGDRPADRHAGTGRTSRRSALVPAWRRSTRWSPTTRAVTSPT